MRADFAIAGVQSGCACLSSANVPATTGLDIDVPAIACHSSPAGTDGSDGSGVLPAMICAPGALMSGLMMSPFGTVSPRLEKYVIVGLYMGSVSMPSFTSCAVGAACEFTHVRIASPG